MSGSITVFNYDALEKKPRLIIEKRTGEIKTLMRRSAQDIIDIGEKLIEVKAHLRHGDFTAWLRIEFGWSDRTAQNFMRVAKVFKSENFSPLSFAPSALYLLASSTTPDEARGEAFSRAQAGEEITHKTAEEIVLSHKRPSFRDETKDPEFVYNPNALISLDLDPDMDDDELREVLNSEEFQEKKKGLTKAVDAMIGSAPTTKPYNIISENDTTERRRSLSSDDNSTFQQSAPAPAFETREDYERQRAKEKSRRISKALDHIQDLLDPQFTIADFGAILRQKLTPTQCHDLIQSLQD